MKIHQINEKKNITANIEQKTQDDVTSNGLIDNLHQVELSRCKNPNELEYLF